MRFSKIFLLLSLLTLVPDGRVFAQDATSDGPIIVPGNYDRLTESFDDGDRPEDETAYSDFRRYEEQDSADASKLAGPTPTPVPTSGTALLSGAAEAAAGFGSPAPTTTPSGPTPTPTATPTKAPIPGPNCCLVIYQDYDACKGKSKDECSSTPVEPKVTPKPGKDSDVEISYEELYAAMVDAGLLEDVPALPVDDGKGISKVNGSKCAWAPTYASFYSGSPTGYSCVSPFLAAAYDYMKSAGCSNPLIVPQTGMTVPSLGNFDYSACKSLNAWIDTHATNWSCRPTLNSFTACVQGLPDGVSNCKLCHGGCYVFKDLDSYMAETEKLNAAVAAYNTAHPGCKLTVSAYGNVGPGAFCSSGNTYIKTVFSGSVYETFVLPCHDKGTKCIYKSETGVSNTYKCSGTGEPINHTCTDGMAKEECCWDGTWSGKDGTCPPKPTAAATATAAPAKASDMASPQPTMTTIQSPVPVAVPVL